jgi:predicted DNA-binding WGR domain protein
MDWLTDEAQANAAPATLEAIKRRRGYRVEPQQLTRIA